MNRLKWLSLIGDIALDKGEPKGTPGGAGKRNGAAMGGHLLEAHVPQTLKEGL